MNERIAGVSGGRTSALMRLKYVPADTISSALPARRHKLLVKQETARAVEASSFSCHCEGAEKFADGDLL